MPVQIGVRNSAGYAGNRDCSAATADSTYSADNVIHITEGSGVTDWDRHDARPGRAGNNDASHPTRSVSVNCTVTLGASAFNGSEPASAIGTCGYCAYTEDNNRDRYINEPGYSFHFVSSSRNSSPRAKIILLFFHRVFPFESVFHVASSFRHPAYHCR